MKQTLGTRISPERTRDRTAALRLRDESDAKDPRQSAEESAHRIHFPVFGTGGGGRGAAGTQSPWFRLDLLIIPPQEEDSNELWVGSHTWE